MTTTTDRVRPDHIVHTVHEPPLSRTLFADTRLSLLWAVLRVYVGYEWLSAGIEKAGSPAWVGAQAGSAVGGFLKGALAKTGGDHPSVQGWYAWFIEHVALPNAARFSWERTADALIEEYAGAALAFRRALLAGTEVAV